MAIDKAPPAGTRASFHRVAERFRGKLATQVQSDELRWRSETRTLRSKAVLAGILDPPNGHDDSFASRNSIPPLVDFGPHLLFFFVLSFLRPLREKTRPFLRIGGRGRLLRHGCCPRCQGMEINSPCARHFEMSCFLLGLVETAPRASTVVCLVQPGTAHLRLDVSVWMSALMFCLCRRCCSVRVWKCRAESPSAVERRFDARLLTVKSWIGLVWGLRNRPSFHTRRHSTAFG